MKQFTTEMVTEAKSFYEDGDYEGFFDLFFNVYVDEDDNDIELETWTESGVNMFVTMKLDDTDYKDVFDNFCDRAHSFDIDDEIRLMREDPRGSYCQSFTCAESVKDYTDYKEWLEEIASIIEGTWEEDNNVEECPSSEIIKKIAQLVKDSKCPNTEDEMIDFIKRNWYNV